LLLLRDLLTVFTIAGAPLLLAHSELLLLKLLLVEGRVEGGLGQDLLGLLGGPRNPRNAPCFVEEGLRPAYMRVVHIIDVDTRGPRRRPHGFGKVNRLCHGLAPATVLDLFITRYLEHFLDDELLLFNSSAVGNRRRSQGRGDARVIDVMRLRLLPLKVVVVAALANERGVVCRLTHHDDPSILLRSSRHASKIKGHLKLYSIYMSLL